MVGMPYLINKLEPILLFFTMVAICFLVIFVSFLYQLNFSFPFPLPNTATSSSSDNNSPWFLVATTWHDRTCFTQGLQFIDANTAIESCGLYGKSRVQEIDFTEHYLNSSVPPRITKRLDLPRHLFAEGITLANGLLYLITWQENVMWVIEPQTLAFKKELHYPLEGWGLVYRPSSNTFLATSGSHNIYHLSVGDHGVSILRTVPVICHGQQITNLNELEFVDNDLFANVWQTDQIYRLNPDTGKCY